MNLYLLSFASEGIEDTWPTLNTATLIGHLQERFPSSLHIDSRRVRSMREADNASNWLKRNQYDCIAFSLEIGADTFFRRVLHNLRGVQLSGNPLYICGGTLATYARDYLLANPDLAEKKPIFVQGEGEIALERILVRRMQNQKPDPVFNADEELILKGLQAPPALLEDGRTFPVHMIETSRGCIFNCSYCSQGPGKTWRSFSMERIEKNIENLLEQGVNALEFIDNEFWGGSSAVQQERVHQIAGCLIRSQKKYGRRLSFRVFTNPHVLCKDDGFRPGIKDTIYHLQAAGLKRIYLGIESGSPTQRKRFNRVDTLAECVSALRLLEELGIELDIGYLLFDPEVTGQELKDSIRFYREHDLCRYNSWPFRHISLTYSTPMYNRAKALGLVGEREADNAAAFTYRFIHPQIGELFGEVRRFAGPAATLFYNLKYLYKELFYSTCKEKIDELYRYINASAEIHLEFIEERIDAEEEELCLQRANEKMLALLCEVEKNMPLLNELVLAARGIKADYIQEALWQAKAGHAQFTKGYGEVQYG